MLTIRPARPADAVAILEVHRVAILARCASHYPQTALDAWAIGPTPERIASQEQRIADPAIITLVAESDGEIIGFAIAAPAAQELRSLYVKPNPIGRVGSALLAELERRAFQTCDHLTCDASLNAVPFYTAHGYTEESRVEHTLSSGARIPCVRMSKSRSAAPASTNEPFDYPASILESDTSVIFCLDPDLNITYCNPAWDHFALDNGSERLCRPAPIGRCVLDYIDGPDRDYYATQYKRILAQSEPWERDYECSSSETYRKFRLRVVPMHKNPGLVVINSLSMECPHDLPACAPLEELYRTPAGLIVMCGSCRRTRRNRNGVDQWDWVPEFVRHMPHDVSHGLCAHCLELYLSYG